MERSEVCGGGGDEDEGKAFVLRFGVLLAFWEVESGEDRGTAAVEEVEGSVGDGDDGAHRGWDVLLGRLARGAGGIVAVGRVGGGVES